MTALATLRFVYRNHRGEVAPREVAPVAIYFGSTQHRPAPQWLLRGYDHDRAAYRDYALADVVQWMPRATAAALAPPEPEPGPWHADCHAPTCSACHRCMHWGRACRRADCPTNTVVVETEPDPRRASTNQWLQETAAALAELRAAVDAALGPGALVGPLEARLTARRAAAAL